MSDCVKSFLSVLHRALERERHFALFEEVPCQPKARSVIVSGQDSRSDPCISSVTTAIMITTSNSPVKGSGMPNQLLGVNFTPSRFPGCPACEPNLFNCS